MIVKNLWRRKTRTVLTLLGIAVGVAAVVSLSSPAPMVIMPWSQPNASRTGIQARVSRPP